jgi:holliday junction DNA helicase RuvB
MSSTTNKAQNSDQKADLEDLAVQRDQVLDSSLRPQTFDEYVGQDLIKKNLNVLLSAAKERNHQPEHILFYGPPGLGKTTLSHLVAKSLGANMKSTSGPAIEKVGDLASILTNLEPGDVLFIDEIHRLNKMIEEVLYPAMESGVIDIIIGKGPAARTIQLDLPAFTLVAATTRLALLSSPLRSRFSGGIYRLEHYKIEEIENIILRSAKILGVELDGQASNEIAKRARSTPRMANYIVKRVRDYAQVYKKNIDRQLVADVMTMLEIDSLGLTQQDRNLLKMIIDNFKGGPVGLNTLSASLSEEEETIEDVIEPYLLQIGLLERTPRGRSVTDKAIEHIRNIN